MNLHNSYFAIKSPLEILDRWLNPFRHSARLQFRGKELVIRWTDRAEKAFKLRGKPLIAEMQLYFSCVVKKRVLFHDDSTMDKYNVNNKLDISFRSVQSSACSPEEFANNYPVNNEFNSNAAKKMHPSLLYLDYHNGNWKGEFIV
jgi:hypothetical protein